MATTIKYDVSDVEEFTTYTGPTPKRGIYEGRISSAEYGASQAGNNKFTFTVILDSKKKDQKAFNGCPLFQHSTIGDLSEDWQKRNLKMVIKAFGLKEKGSLNPEALCKKAEGSRIRVIVKNEMYNDELVARANGLLPLKGEDADEDGEDADVDEDATEDADEDGDEAEVDEDEEDGEEDAVDLDELDRAELKTFIKDNELEIKVTTKMSDDAIRDAIRTAMGVEDEEADEEDDEDEDDGLDELDRAGLKKHIKDNELGIKVTTKMSDDDIRSAIREAQGAEGDEDEDGDEPPF